MKNLKATILVILLFSFFQNLIAQHVGKNYPRFGGMVMDPNSRTFDNANGNNVVVWNDRYNFRHEVYVQPGYSYTVFFPIPNGGSWLWWEGSGSQERTGFNASVTFVEATFWWDGDHVRIQSTGFYPNGTTPDPDIWNQMKQVFRNADELLKVGAQTVQDAYFLAGLF